MLFFSYYSKNMIVPFILVSLGSQSMEVCLIENSEVIVAQHWECLCLQAAVLSNI